PQNDVTLKMPAFEWVHVQLHQQKGMISLSPPTICNSAMSNASELRGLHGDLHHENIMFSSRGWLVIDPVGLVGEVGFGAANMFYDPADRDDLCLDPRRIAQMADAFSRALDVDPRRLLDQAYAYGCLSAAWNADGEEEQRDLAIAAAIKQVRQTSY
uniref:aminoglycoside phosphotransferase family protein n=1 Tax=Klebsiella pneumoniae TaxID=573 RepID=UPI001D0D5FF2